MGPPQCVWSETYVVQGVSPFTRIKSYFQMRKLQPGHGRQGLELEFFLLGLLLHPASDLTPEAADSSPEMSCISPGPSITHQRF